MYAHEQLRRSATRKMQKPGALASEPTCGDQKAGSKCLRTNRKEPRLETTFLPGKRRLMPTAASQCRAAAADKEAHYALICIRSSSDKQFFGKVFESRLKYCFVGRSYIEAQQEKPDGPSRAKNVSLSGASALDAHSPGALSPSLSQSVTMSQP